MDNLHDMLENIEATCGACIVAEHSAIHGLSHLREVSLLAGQLATDMGVSVEFAMVAGFLHDCGRVDDKGGTEHAHRSAAIAKHVVTAQYPHLEVDRLCYAIAAHADGEVTDDPLVGVIWDADRLTLIRLNREVDCRLLSTRAGKSFFRKRRVSETGSYPGVSSEIL